MLPPKGYTVLLSVTSPYTASHSMFTTGLLPISATVLYSPVTLSYLSYVQVLTGMLTNVPATSLTFDASSTSTVTSNSSEISLYLYVALNPLATTAPSVSHLLALCSFRDVVSFVTSLRFAALIST